MEKCLYLKSTGSQELSKCPVCAGTAEVNYISVGVLSCEENLAGINGNLRALSFSSMHHTLKSHLHNHLLLILCNAETNSIETNFECVRSHFPISFTSHDILFIE